MNNRNDGEFFDLKCRLNSVFESLTLQKPHIFCYDLTDSTNTRAKCFAESGENVGCAPAIFFSRAQSAGRGTRSRTFESPQDAGAYVSFLFYPERLPGGAGITAYAAVAAARAVDSLSGGRLTTRIKWVNDLVINDKKLGGILSESRLNGDGCDYAIVGIGINLRTDGHSPEVTDIMTSLADVGVDTTPHELALALTREFFAHLEEAGEESTLEEYRSRSSIIGREVTLSRSEKSEAVHVIRIDGDGSLIVKDKNGCEHKYNSGDVSIRPARNEEEA